MYAAKAFASAPDVTALSAEIGRLAYIKKVPDQKGTGYALCSADGKQLAAFASRDAAYFTARQHGLEPVSLH